jgi:NADPH:quinone reductase-like Zn-dependent oxidoreductase
MRALHLIDSVLIEGSAQQPEPSTGEVLVRVHAAGIIATELQWDPTLHTKTGAPRVRPIPGHEFSGTVAGEDVYGMNDWYSDGAMAEYCVAPFSAISPKPKNLTHAEAASVPISGLTAWQGLFDHAKLQKGELVLVHGGAGAVGTFVIQLAHLHGAHVVTTASPRNFELVKSLGADEVIDYHSTPFDRQLHHVDVVFDTAGGETLERSWKVLKPNGRMITIVSGAEGSADERIKKAFFIVEQNGDQLAELTKLIESNHLRPVVDSVITLAQAPGAFAGRSQRRGFGKVVVDLDDRSVSGQAR